MKDSIIDIIDENQVRDVLNFFARKAYGKDAEIAVDDKLYVKISNTKLFLFIFNDDVCKAHKFSYDIKSEEYDYVHDISYKPNSLWRDTLKYLTKAVANGKYVAYLPEVNHLLDSNSSIEEALIQIELITLDENEK